MRGVRSAARWLFAPVDNTPLVLFRVLFGLLAALETGGSIATGWVHANLIEPRVAFPMIGFEWVRPLPGTGMVAYYALMAICGVLVLLGAFYRLALAAFAVLWTGAYVMQTVSYNNHYYLILLLALLLLPMPANAWLALDARRVPALRSVTCPRWCIAVLVAQFALVYFFAAVAKLEGDWLTAQPLEVWFEDKPHIVAPLLDERWLQHAIAWSGLAFDALIVPLLLWKRTRVAALVVAVVFHLTNSYLFRIGVFPYLALGACVLFFPGEALRRRFLPQKPPAPPPLAPDRLSSRQRVATGALAAWFALQVALPLRHHFYPGDVSWTEEGHRMSWRMMLRSKTGVISFQLSHPPSGRRWTVRPEEFLTRKQAQRTAIRPELAWQFAQFLEQHYAEQGVTPLEVRARSLVSLNGRPSQPLIDPEVDLAAEEWSLLAPTAWIVPLEPRE